MTNTANTIKKPCATRPAAIIGEYTDSALLHLDGASGLLFLLQSTLEPTAPALSDSEVVGIIATAQSLIQLAYDDLQKDSGNWTSTLLKMDGVRGALKALSSGYLSECDLPNNRIQIAAIHSLQHIVTVCQRGVSA